MLESVDFDPDAKRIDLYLDFAHGTKFDCPVCNKPGCSAYDSKEKEGGHLDFFQHKAFLHCRVPRVSCDECGIHQIKIPWARESSGFTLLMDALIMSMAQSMQISEIADMIGEHDTRVWRVVKYYVENARSREDFSDVYIIGIDETSSAKGHKYSKNQCSFQRYIFVRFDSKKLV